ncbi:MAG: class I SAM-dependent methyltransferase [Coriobacteriales bacterium]|jgi:SAM-dependent methyltransferase|nr:class I SAM-dependent methyltransferase [Coriobacteriales bacterium]
MKKAALPLTEFDWDAEWKRVQKGRSSAYASAFWDKRAPGFRAKKVSDYERSFLSFAGIEEGWSVLDVGCGSGTFSLPLALEGHRITAVDFSQGMLDQLAQEAAADGVQDWITCINGSWDDDWQELGIEPGSVDVALASRSFLTLELAASLQKLNTAARRRVCLTVGVAAFPFFDVPLFQAIGHEPVAMGDYFLVLGALASLGIVAEVRLIGSSKRDVYLDSESAREAALMMLGPVSAEEEQRLERYLDEHLIPWRLTSAEYEHLQAHRVYRDLRVPASAQTDTAEAEHRGVAKDYLRDTRWAFISWDVTA